MTEGEPFNPYQKAVVKFGHLGVQRFSAERYQSSLEEVYNAGTSLGIDNMDLFGLMHRLSGEAAARAGEDPSSKTFLEMQEGYKAALDRLTTSQQVQAPRPRTGIAAG
jgi:hypothetical protein